MDAEHGLSGRRDPAEPGRSPRTHGSAVASSTGGTAAGSATTRRTCPRTPLWSTDLRLPPFRSPPSPAVFVRLRSRTATRAPHPTTVRAGTARRQARRTEARKSRRRRILTTGITSLGERVRSSRVTAVTRLRLRRSRVLMFRPSSTRWRRHATTAPSPGSCFRPCRTQRTERPRPSCPLDHVNRRVNREIRRVWEGLPLAAYT